MSRFVSWSLQVALVALFVAVTSTLAFGARAEAAKRGRYADAHRANGLAVGARELAGRRTVYSSTYRNPDGTLTTSVSATPVNFADRHGRLHRIDSRLVPSASHAYAWKNGANRFALAFKPTTSAGFLRFRLLDRHFVFSLAGSDPSASGRAQGETLTYGRVLDGVDLHYAVLPDGLKETLAIRNANAPSHYRFVMTAGSGPRLHAERQRGGAWAIFDAARPEPLFFVEAPTAVDSPPTPSLGHDEGPAKRSDFRSPSEGQVTTTVRKVGGHFVVDVAVDPHWLHSPGRAFPVLVDPTITVQGTSQFGNFDWTCSTCVPTTDDRVFIGTTDTKIYRSALQFGLGSVPAGAAITDAQLRLYYDGMCLTVGTNPCQARTQQFDALRITQPWSINSTTGSLQFNSTPVASVNFSTIADADVQWLSWNLTQTVKDWFSGLTPNNGVLMKLNNETLGASGIRPPSGRFAEATLKPKLDITYTGDAVSLLPIVANHADGAELQWTKYVGESGASFDRYELHRSTTPKFTPTSSTLLATIRDVNVTRYRDTTAAPSKTFYYKIVANTSASNEQSTTTPGDGKATRTIQSTDPASLDGESTTITNAPGSATQCANLGADRNLRLEASPTATRRALLYFDLRDVPTDATVNAARLSLWRPYANGFGATVDLHRVTRAWEEGTGLGSCTGDGATWSESQGGVGWSAAGGDYDPTPDRSLTTSTAAAFDNYYIEPLVSEWVSGTSPNLGVLLKLHDETPVANHQFDYYSDDFSVAPSLRPKLYLNYSDGSHAVAPTVSVATPSATDEVGGTAYSLTAAASDDRRVDKVEFLVDGAVVATDTTAPFGASWNSSTATNSTHTFSARATDDAGNVTTSAAVSADVDNSAAPTTSITSPSAAYRGVVLADGPNGYWRLGETSGTTAADASGNARTGTLGGTYLLAQTGMLTNDADKSILFKNATTDGSVSFTNSTTWLSGSVLTAEAWVKYTTISTAGACDRVLSRGWGTTNSGRWFLGLCKSSGGVQQAQFGLNSTIAAATVTPGTLHLVGTYDGATIRLYVNGAQVASAAASGTLYVGAGPSIAQTLNDDVTIDEAAVYAKALSAGQIKAHYDAGLGNGPTVGGTINVTASAADDRAVTHVEFYVDSDRFADLTNSPYTAPLDTTNLALPVYNGTHTLTTKAYDIGGHVTTSAPVAVTASNAAFGSKHSATITAATAVPAAVTYDPAASVQDKYGVNVTVKNTSAVSWLTSDVVLRYRWISPDTSGNVVYTDGADVPLPANLTAGGSVTLSGLLVSPPTLPDGVNRGQYTLRFDLFDKAPGGGWFADKGNPPLDNPVIVNKALVRDALGLERYYHYVGQNVGAGMQQLTNIANGNSILRWTPFDEPGVGLASVLDLTYNALEKKCDCPAGNNWSLALSSLSRFGNPIDIHPNNADTIAGRSNKFVELTDGDGTTHRFTDSNNDGYWEAPAGVHLYLRATGSTDPNKYWALTRPDRVTFYYDHDGYPQSVVDGNNNTLTFTESSVAPADDPGGPRLKVTKVVDAKNRSFTVTYYTKADAKRPQIRGRVKQITDHVGRTLLFDYYLDGNLLRITQKGGVNPDGTTLPDRSFVFTYTTSDGSGPAISSATARANPDAGTANESTRLYSVRDPRGHETTFSYLGPGYGTDRWKLASITDRAQKTTTFAYDTTNRVTTVTAPLARKSTYSYDAEGKVTAITNPLGQQTTVAWGGDRAVSKVTEPTGVFTTFTYNDNGYLTSTTDQLGHMTQLAYDNSALDGNDVSTKWESGRTIPHISDLASKTDPKGVETTTILNDYQWTFAHDTKGNITGITDPLGKTTTNVFNGDGTLASTTDARGDKTTFPTYDANGLATTIVDPLGNAPGGVAAEHQTTFGYDAAGDLLSVQDALHQKYGATSRTNASYFDYDPFGRMVRQSAPKSTELLPGKLIWSGATFDPNDNLATQTYPHYGTIDDNAGGDQTTFGYDDMDRLTSQVVPHDPTNTDPAQKTHTTTYAYDDAGRLITQTDPQGVLTAKTDKDYATFLDYDPLDRITTQTRYRVDDLGTVVETQKVHACYDLAGDLRSVTAPKGDAAFPGCPNATTTNYTPLAGNYTTSYAFYADHKLKKTTDPLGRSQSLTYDSNGDADSFTDENGTTSTRGYDQKRQLVLEKQPFRSGTSAKNLFTIYRYDAVGNLSALVSPRAYDASTDPTKQTNPLGVNYTSYVTSYDYDATDRLTRELLPTGGSDTQQLYVHHAYDPLGRQSWASLSTDQAAAGSVVDSERSQFTYFDTGWVHTSKDPAEPLVTFDYTAKGEQSERTRAQGTNDPTPNNTERWSYFADGDLQQEIDPHGSPTTYSYDANDNPTDIDDTGGVQTPDETELVVQQSYDGFDRLIKTRQQKLNKPWHVSTYGYDLNNNVSTSEDDAIESPATPGRVTDYAYDQADQVLTQTDHGLQTGCGDDQLIQYTYEQTRDLRDELVSRASASCTDQSPGWTVKEQTSNTYFLDGSLSTAKVWNGASATGTLTQSHTLAYEDANGVYLNGNTARDTTGVASAAAPCPVADPCDLSYTYDAKDRLIHYGNGRNGSTTYTLKPNGLLASESFTNGTISWTKTYGYNAPNGVQVTSLLRQQTQPSASTTSQRFFYTHGDLTCVTHDDATSSTRADCPAAQGGTISPRLDESYGYDDLDRLTGYHAYLNGGETDSGQWTHDALDRVSSEKESHPGVSRTIAFDYLGLSADAAKETWAGDGATTKTYSYDATGSKISLSDSAQGGRARLYAYNPHGDVSQLLDLSGTATAAYGYRPYGDEEEGSNAISQGDSGSARFKSAAGVLNNYRYSAKRFDTAAGAIDMGARFFSPQYGSFLQEDYLRDALGDVDLATDPLTGTRYGLAGGNPVGFVEVDGHRVAPGGGGGRRKTGSAFWNSPQCVEQGRLRCTLRAWKRASYPQREAWLVKANRNWNLGKWLDVFRAIPQYFDTSPTFARTHRDEVEDAGVLWVISRGLAAATNWTRLKRSEPSASRRWRTFFTHLRTGTYSDTELKHSWAEAEIAGVRFGQRLGEQSGIKWHGLEDNVYDAFLDVGDSYRHSLLTNGYLPQIGFVIRRKSDPRRDRGLTLFGAKYTETQVINACAQSFGIGPNC